MQDWAAAGSEDTSKLPKEMSRMPMSPIPGPLHSVSQPAPMVSREVLHNQLTEEENTWDRFTGNSV